MEGKKPNGLILFRDIIGSETHSDEEPATEGGGSMVEEDLNIQESDRTGSEVTTCNDDPVDLTLRLSYGCSSSASTGQCKKVKSENQVVLRLLQLNIAAQSNNHIVHGQPSNRPMPLRPSSQTLCVSGPHDPSLNLELSQESRDKGIETSATDDAGEATSGNTAKRAAFSNDQHESKSVKKKTSTVVSHRTTEPIPVIEHVPRLRQIIESKGGTPAVFLYRKKLQASDVSKDQNRIFLTQCEQLMDFLTEEEKESVCTTKEGLEIDAVDQEEKSYKLGLVTWPSVQMPVLKSQWGKLIEGNNVETGFWVEMWGYRLEGKFCLAVNFRKPAEEAEAQPNNRSNGVNNGQN